MVPFVLGLGQDVKWEVFCSQKNCSWLGMAWAMDALGRDSRGQEEGGKDIWGWWMNKTIFPSHQAFFPTCKSKRFSSVCRVVSCYDHWV